MASSKYAADRIGELRAAGAALQRKIFDAALENSVALSAARQRAAALRLQLQHALEQEDTVADHLNMLRLRWLEGCDGLGIGDLSQVKAIFDADSELLRRLHAGTEAVRALVRDRRKAVDAAYELEEAQDRARNLEERWEAGGGGGGGGGGAPAAVRTQDLDATAADLADATAAAAGLPRKAAWLRLLPAERRRAALASSGRYLRLLVIFSLERKANGHWRLDDARQSRRR